jgi:hypothetical protein
MSGKANTKSNIPKDDLSKVKQIIDRIEEKPEAEGFLEPVNYVCKI